VSAPRRTRLVAAATLPAFQEAVRQLAVGGSLADIRRRVVIVPSRAAAAQFRHTLEARRFSDAAGAGDAALALPDLLTREEWYQRMHERSGLPQPRLTALERETILAASARAAIASGSKPPFKLRPGLVAEMVGFYDALGRHERTLDDFERTVVGELEPRASTDRGAERLLEQTRFLLAAFRDFERRVAASGGLDERALRRYLLDPSTRPAYSHVVVTVADRAADPSGGLFPADFDLVMRLPGVEAIDIVATRAVLASGLEERLDALIPGIDRVAAEEVPTTTRIVAPAGDQSRLHFTSRDREEELRSIARRVKDAARRSEPPPALDRIAVVFSRPLPYVYLAGTVFESAGIEYQAADALPLAAEPMAAVLDLVFAAVDSRFSRGALVALLRSPHLGWEDGAGQPLSADEIDAFDRGLAESRYAGGTDALGRLADRWTGDGSAAAAASVALAAELGPLASARPLSAQAATVLDFLRARERVNGSDAAVRARHLRARGAILSALGALARAALAFDDPVVRCDALAAAVRRWLEAETFSPRRGTGGVQIVDAQAARYGAFDTVFIAGLIEGDWPGPSPRNIFYPAFLLAQLGWPAESARLAAARAGFADLLSLALETVSVSSFTLEDDAIVNPSGLLEELPRAALGVERIDSPATLVFADEALSLVRPAPKVLTGEAALWLALREGRSPSGAPEFHGDAGPTRRARHSVTSIDTYLQCPFKYFASKVLELPEEVSDEPSMTPQSEGKFVHEVLQAFFEFWQASGGGAITADQLDLARARFAEVAGRLLATLPAAEAALQRARLLGSVGTPGLGEIVLAASAARPEPVRERLLEHEFDGFFTMTGHGEAREVRLRGKADRVDLFDDGTFRIVDYKSGRFPDPAQTVQLPVYAVCVAEDLARKRGGAWRVREASYIAFGEPKPVRVVIADGPQAAEKLAEGQERLLDAVDAIERGEFPPRPASTRLCGYCAYASVCRKDYVDGE
jgi:RecB family exonuclease